VDFLDPSVVSKVTATNPLTDVAAAAAARRAAGSVQLGHGVVQDARTGKLIVGGGKTELSGAAAAAMLDVEELSQELKGRAREKRKRAQEAEDEAAEAAADVEEARRATKKQVRPTGSFQAPGAQFRSSKAGGDMQRRGQMSPYAFVPLEPSALNRRKKVTATRRMESIVNAAKAGSQAGTSAHHKQRGHQNKSHKKHGH